jgi:hypothetical protein
MTPYTIIDADATCVSRPRCGWSDSTNASRPRPRVMKDPDGKKAPSSSARRDANARGRGVCHGEVFDKALWN